MMVGDHKEDYRTIASFSWYAQVTLSLSAAAKVDSFTKPNRIINSVVIPDWTGS